MQKNNTLEAIQRSLRRYATKERARVNAWFFKTGKGEYGEGDQFIGVSVPDIRIVAHHYQGASFSTIKQLLASPIHEDRLLALLILVTTYEKASDEEKSRITKFYLSNKIRINNWDLVDTSASYILGASLYKKDVSILYTLGASKRLWDRRIAIVATHYFIKQKQYKDTLALAVLLMKDTEDLIHKAVGWMLREVGKKDEVVLKKFLDQYHKEMPRTMLRYAIERLSLDRRRYYMGK